MLQSSLRRILVQISSIVYWIIRNYGYLCEIVAAILLLFWELVLLFIFGVDQGFLLCLWIFFPTYRLGLRLQALPQGGASWVLVVVIPLLLVGFPILASYLMKNAITNIILWTKYPDQRAAYLLQRETAFLTYARVNALFENRRNHDWKQIMRGTLTASAGETDTVMMPLTISKYAGQWSFVYVTLSNYLGISPVPNEYREDHTATINALPTSTLTHTANKEIWVPPPYGLSLLGTVRLRLVGSQVIEARIKNARHQELLAYLSKVAREQTVGWSRIVTESYPTHTSEENKDILRRLFDSDIKELRKLLKSLCQQAGLPYINPIQVDGRGPGALYRLADAYVVTDISRMERLAEKMKRMKQEDRDSLDLQAFREEYDAVLQSYTNGFLEQNIREKQIGAWARVYYTRYGMIYHQILYDIAEYEYAIGTTQQDEAQKTGLKRAVDRYEQYITATIAQLSDKSKPEGPLLLIEHALRQCITAYGLLRDVSSARHIYSHTIKMGMRKYPDWKLASETVHAYEEVTDSSRKDGTEE